MIFIFKQIKLNKRKTTKSNICIFGCFAHKSNFMEITKLNYLLVRFQLDADTGLQVSNGMSIAVRPQHWELFLWLSRKFKTCKLNLSGNLCREMDVNPQNGLKRNAMTYNDLHEMERGGILRETYNFWSRCHRQGSLFTLVRTNACGCKQLRSTVRGRSIEMCSKSVNGYPWPQTKSH